VKILILDDEAASLKAMRDLCAPHDDVEIVGEARDVERALELTRRYRPDAAFIDVRLRGETGFDYAGQLSGFEPRLIFLTAYDQYAIQAFECNAMDYLLKPVSPERLGEALYRIRRHELLKRRAASEGDAVFLRFDQAARLVPWKTISHIEAHGNYTQVFLSEGKSAMILRPLKDWLPLLPPGMFVRAHRGVIVRIHAVRSLDFSQPRQRRLLLLSGDAVSVGRAYWPDVRAAMLSWHPEIAEFLP